MRRIAHHLGTRMLAVLTLSTTGCQTWHPVVIPRAGAEPTPVAPIARVTFRDGRVSEVAQMRFARDSMHAARAGVLFAVPADSLRAVQVRRLDWFRTMALGAGILGFSLLFGG